MFDDTSKLIFDETQMNRWANDDKKRDQVLVYLRYLLGAQLYLTDSSVKDIFKTQKTRMGNILNELDLKMEENPRKVGKDKEAREFAAWEKQNLLEEWNKHMDDTWNNAAAKVKKVMKMYTDKLDNRYCKKEDSKGDKDKGDENKEQKDKGDKSKSKGKEDKGKGKGKEDKGNGKEDKGKGNEKKCEGESSADGKDKEGDCAATKVFCERLEKLKAEYKEAPNLSKPW